VRTSKLLVAKKVKIFENHGVSAWIRKSGVEVVWAFYGQGDGGPFCG